MIRTVRAEWTKLRTVRGTGWLLLGIVGGTVAVSAAIVFAQNAGHCPAGCDLDPPRISLTGVYLGQIAVAVLAVLAVTGEYATGTIGTTLAATPRRGVLLLAKVAVVAAATLGAGALGVLGSFAAGRLILPANGFDRSNGHPPLSLADAATLRATVGTVLYLGLIALLGLGIGLAVRDTAVALTAVLALLYVLPLVAAMLSDEVWRERILKVAPMSAGLTIQATKHLDTLPLTPWRGLGVLAAYAAAAMLLGGLRFRFRDA
jgi:ABC-2 type transport system permease protein